MPKYRPGVLVTHVETIYLRIFLVLLGYVITAFAISVLWNGTIGIFHEFEQVVSLGRMKFNVAEMARADDGRRNFTVLLGLFLAIVRSFKLNVEAQKVVCIIEVEKRLRRLEEKVVKGGHV